MRILDLNNLYSPTGGGVRTYHERKLQWALRHPEVSAALVVPAAQAGKLVAGNTVRYEVPALSLGRSGYRLIVRPGPLRRVIADFEPDVIELGSVYVEPWLLNRIDPEGRYARVGFVHADYPDTYVAPAVARAWAPLGRGALEQARAHAGRNYGALTATFAASEHVLDKLYGWGVRRLFHTPLGVDLGQYSPSSHDPIFRRALGVEPTQRLVVCVSRLAPEKGIDLLLEAWPHVQARDIVLAVIGHGPLQARVDAFAQTAHGVRRSGFLADPAEVAQALGSADAALVLGQYETFSLTTLEALACGTPVIAPDLGGAGELVARAGLQPFVAGDARSLAAAIDAVAPRAAGEVARLRTWVEASYGWDGVFDRHLEIYRRVVAAHRSGDLTPLLPTTGRWTGLPGRSPA